MCKLSHPPRLVTHNIGEFFRFLQISRRASRVTNSPTLEVIASPVANFIVLCKRKLKHQPSGAFLKATNGKISAFAAGPAQKGAKCPDLHTSSLGGNFLHCAI